MYNSTLVLMVAYIKSVVANLDVFDANKPFKNPDNYAVISILNLDPMSPHGSLVDAYKDIDLNTKKFIFNQSKYINVRVDFRGVDSAVNMDLFTASFFKEIQTEILRVAGFGFLGVGAVQPITNLRDIKAKAGMTTTIKLSATQIITDDSQIIISIPITVSNTL